MVKALYHCDQDAGYYSFLYFVRKGLRRVVIINESDLLSNHLLLVKFVLPCHSST